MKFHHARHKPVLISLLAGALLISGCASNEAKNSENTQSPATDQAAAAPAPTPAPAVQQKPICKDEPKPATKKSKKKGKKTEPAKPPVDCIPASEVQAAAAAAPSPAPQASSNTGYYDLSKNKPVDDSTQVESGQGTLVKGIDDWEGEISGIPAPGSKFTQLKIGMPIEQVYQILGQPSDQGGHITGKAWIPFYHGSDRSRYELVYQGQGRLIFSQQGGWGWGGGGSHFLTWIIHSANEKGQR